MRSVSTDPRLSELLERVLHHAKEADRTIPEIRFFILEGLEFASLLEKRVYPASPMNIWEGKRMVNKKHRIETGQESTLYYEVVQTGDPSYAYLNSSNSPVIQASVMAHVVGHCEFSELNVLHDSTPDRTEYVMYKVKQVNAARRQMGKKDYLTYWNACESAADLIAPNSQYSLARSVETETAMSKDVGNPSSQKSMQSPGLMPFSGTLQNLLRASPEESILEIELSKKRRRETLNRKGYFLKAPCQDVFGFLRRYSPASVAERNIMEYLYVIHAPGDFVRRTQIMNEGWAMYWEKKIMTELFKEKAVNGIIEYAKVFSGVCRPRPYYARNPYQLGYNLWKHIEKLYSEGKVCLEYVEEIDLEKKEHWKKETTINPSHAMKHLVETITDYEFLRRFLTSELIHEFHLNRLHRTTAERLGVKEKDIVDADKEWVWLHPEPIKDEMLNFFTHYYQPRIYVIDSDFQDGGLLLYHRDDGRPLRKDWIKPTLRNLNTIWKGQVHLLSRGGLYSYGSDRYREDDISPLSFEQVTERLSKGKKALRRV